MVRATTKPLKTTFLVPFVSTVGYVCWQVMTIGRVPVKRTTVMARRPRRTHSASFKAQMAVAALLSDNTIAEKFEVHPDQVAARKVQLL